jgi:hypothetical protein
MLPTKFWFIWPSGFRGEHFFKKSTNQKQEMPVAAMLVNGSRQNEQFYKDCSFRPDPLTNMANTGNSCF